MWKRIKSRFLRRIRLYTKVKISLQEYFLGYEQLPTTFEIREFDVTVNEGSHSHSGNKALKTVYYPQKSRIIMCPRG